MTALDKAILYFKAKHKKFKTTNPQYSQFLFGIHEFLTSLRWNSKHNPSILPHACKEFKQRILESYHLESYSIVVEVEGIKEATKGRLLLQKVLDELQRINPKIEQSERRIIKKLITYWF